MEFGRRLLPQVVDHYAQVEPGRVYASISNSPTDLSEGFQDVTMAKLAAVVNRLSWWLKDLLGEGQLETVAYVGPADIRYAAFFLAAVKCGYKVLFISPRNQFSQNLSMLERSACRAFFYGEELAGIAEAIRDSPLKPLTQVLSSLKELLSTPEDFEYYPYEKTFDEARDDPCLVLHSSGSTGNPKLVTMTHGTFSVTDNDRNMPVPEGRQAQNAAQFNLKGGGKFYSCFPPYHLAGIHAYIDLPIFSTSATVVFGPTGLPPSGYLLSEIIKYQPVRAFYVPPFVIEQWSAEPAATEQCNQLDFILYGGGPLSPVIGDRLSQVTNVCQMYGSLEVGQVQLLVPQTGEWSYMELNPFEEADMQPSGDGTFEMVLHQDPKFATRRSLWHNFPAVKSWHTGDLFVPHPSKPGLWRFHSRVDDLIVFSSSHKLRPLEMETIIQGDPLLSGALLVGQGQPEPLLIVETKPDAYDGTDPESFIDRIWPTVESANKIAPSYGIIRRSRVIMAQPDKPFLRAPKGSVVRKLTTQAYAQEIDTAYGERTAPAETNGVSPHGLSAFLLPGIKQFVRKHVEDHINGVPVSDDSNLFIKGLDSLGATGLSRSLQKGLAAQMQTPASSMSLRTIYTHPTIEGLAQVILSIMSFQEVSEPTPVDGSQAMEQTLKEFTTDLPTVSAPKKLNVALLGPRGSLGPNIVRELAANPQVGKIYCLVRGDDGREKMRTIFSERNIPCDADDERFSFVPVDLGKPKLGLADSDYQELQNNVNIVVHNAWKVDFSWTLDSYKVEQLPSVRELVKFSFDSSLKPRIVFVSSVSSVQEWPSVYSTPVTEEPLDSYDVSAPNGYGQSKHVAERILAEASNVSKTPVTVLRLGQIAGSIDESGGEWPAHEWVPSLVAISKAVGMVPSDIPVIDWVPVNTMAKSIVELLLPAAEESLTNGSVKQNGLITGLTNGLTNGFTNGDTKKHDGDHLFKVFNVVNPQTTDWVNFTRALQTRLGGNTQQVKLTAWVEAVARADPKTLSGAPLQILPFFQHLAQKAERGEVLQPTFETAKAVKASKTMAEMAPIDETLMSVWFKQWGI